MANYKLDYTGEQVNTAIGNALNGGGGGTQLYVHSISVNDNDNIYLIDRNATKYTDLSEELKESLAENTKWLLRNGISIVPLFAELIKAVMPGQTSTLTTYFLLNKAFTDLTINSVNSDNVTPL